MLRKIGFTMLYTASLISTNTFAIPVHSFQQGISIDYDLPSNQPQTFINYMFWPIEANCKISIKDQSDTLFVEALSKKGKINDVLLVAGQTMTVVVVQGQHLKISADSGAQVKITNLGEHTVKATCSLV